MRLVFTAAGDGAWNLVGCWTKGSNSEWTRFPFNSAVAEPAPTTSRPVEQIQKESARQKPAPESKPAPKTERGLIGVCREKRLTTRQVYEVTGEPTDDRPGFDGNREWKYDMENGWVLIYFKKMDGVWKLNRCEKCYPCKAFPFDTGL
jgi:hypothetical protein